MDARTILYERTLWSPRSQGMVQDTLGVDTDHRDPIWDHAARALGEVARGFNWSEGKCKTISKEIMVAQGKLQDQLRSRDELPRICFTNPYSDQYRHQLNSNPMRRVKPALPTDTQGEQGFYIPIRGTPPLVGRLVAVESRHRISNFAIVTLQHSAIGEVAQEAVWLRVFLYELGEMESNEAVHIDEENQGSIALVKIPKPHKHTKLIDIRYHFMRGCFSLFQRPLCWLKS